MKKRFLWIVIAATLQVLNVAAQQAAGGTASQGFAIDPGKPVSAFKKLALSLSEINKFRYLCIRISQET